MKKNLKLIPKYSLQLKLDLKLVAVVTAIGLLIGSILFVYFYVGNQHTSSAANATYNTAASGEWLQSGTWTTTAPSNNPVPQNSTLNINSGHEVVISAGDLSLQQNTDVNVYGTLIIYGDFSMIQNAEILVYSTGVLIVMGNYSSEQNLVLENGGIVLLMGTFNTAQNASVTNNGDFYTDASIPDLTGNALEPISAVSGNPTLVSILENYSLLSSVLPVELLSFEILNEQDHVEIKWATATELNNDYFIIERGIDGKSFSEIGTITGGGTSNEVLKYAFIDDQPLSGMYYYRLIQYDYDGQFEHLKTGVINRIGKEIRTIKVGPNPFSENLTISFDSDEAGIVDLVVTDTQGKRMFSDIIEVSTGANLHSIEQADKLPKDIYLVNLSQKGNWTKTYKVIKN
jgi:hypothetical protein